MDSAKTLQRKVREMRGELTYRAYAKKLGLTLSTLNRLLNSPLNATLRTIDKISRALHVTSSQLLDDTDTRHRLR
jgi:transcriptional regulator with XRE-family HTH domain